MICNFARNNSFSTNVFLIERQTLEFFISEKKYFRNTFVGLVRETNPNPKHQNNENNVMVPHSYQTNNSVSESFFYENLLVLASVFAIKTILLKTSA